jgi:hypothetical protein
LENPFLKTKELPKTISFQGLPLPKQLLTACNVYNAPQADIDIGKALSEHIKGGPSQSNVPSVIDNIILGKRSRKSR